MQYQSHEFSNHAMPRRSMPIVACICAIAFALAPAIAESITYNATVGQEARLSTVAVVPVEGQPSVSLKGLVNAFGGELEVASNTVRVALLNKAATLTLGDTGVAASQEFTLQHPPRVYENDVYIAASDVIAFFAYAFDLEVRTGQPATRPDQSTASALPAGRKLVVVVDAGHGGADPGAIGDSAAPEKTIALAIAQRLEKLLQPTCQVALTRSKDAALTTSERVSMANVALKGDLFISIHAGASGSKSASGFELFCPMGAADPNASRSLALARGMSNGVAQATGAIPRGVRQSPCRIFTNLQMPGVLIEVGFMTNPKEEPLLANADYQDKLAQGIANGIAAYVGGKTQ